MHIKKGFNLRKVCDENVIVAEGKENIDFSKIICINDTSAYLWENITDKEFDIEDMVTLLTDKYDVDEQTARDDSKELVKQLIDAGVIE